MAKKKAAETPEAFPQHLSRSDQLVEWAHDHALAIGLAVGVILVGTAIYAGMRGWSDSRHEEASRAVDAIRRDYLAAMGAGPSALVVPELASPEAAASIRSDFAGRFREAAEAHAGTVSAALAWLEVGEIELAAEDLEAAVAAYQKGLEQVDEASPLRGTLLAKIGHVHERADRWAEAAEAHLAAARVPGFPLRAFALADAARGYDRAGDPTRALDLLEEAEAEGGALPEHLRSRLRELRALQGPPAA